MLSEETPLIPVDVSYLPISTSNTEQKLIVPTPIGPTYCDKKFMWFTVATTGVILYTGTLWWIMFQAEYSLFLLHPAFMSLAFVFVTEGTLLLQRTETVEQKKEGANMHKWFQILGFLFAIFGFAVIFYNKILHNKNHFHSLHGMSGLVTVVYLFAQVFFGLLIYVFPSVLGGIRQGKAMYKYHRISGYLILLLVWLTALGGTQTNWVLEKFDQSWVWLLATFLMAVGVGFRVRPNKMKINLNAVSSGTLPTRTIQLNSTQQS